MHESRRVFLGAAIGLAAAALAGAQSGGPPTGDGIYPPLAGGPRRANPFPVTRRDPAAELKDNQDHIKKDVARLTQLVSELQKGLSSDDTTKVLSLDVMHKAEQIEKLARQIRDLIRG